MRILVHDYVSGGGLAGRDVPESLACEGAAMAAALAADLASLGEHHVLLTSDARFPLRPPRGVDMERLPADAPSGFEALVGTADAVWGIAPETGRCLERLAALAERRGTRWLGAPSRVIRRASDKAALPARLARYGVAHPPTHALGPCDEYGRVARTIGFPLVVKPARGAGCLGVGLAREPAELHEAVGLARAAATAFGPVATPGGGRVPASGGSETVLLQRYVPGTPASVSLLTDGRRALPLALNFQDVQPSRPFCYRGGRTPLDHPGARPALEAAVRACAAFPGLRGFVGVDLVLTDGEPVVIEVNPRVTTAYLGVRGVVDENLAGLVIAACGGRLPASPRVRRAVSFDFGSGHSTLATWHARRSTRN